MLVTYPRSSTYSWSPSPPVNPMIAGSSSFNSIIDSPYVFYILIIPKYTYKVNYRCITNLFNLYNVQSFERVRYNLAFGHNLIPTYRQLKPS